MSRLKRAGGEGGTTGGSNWSEVLRKTLADEQKKKADEVFQALKPEDRVKISGDPKLRNEFLRAAIEASPVVHDSLFAESGNTASVTDDSGFRKLFGLADKDKSVVIGTIRAGASGFVRAGKSDKSTESNSGKRLVGGVIPRPPSTTQQ